MYPAYFLESHQDIQNIKCVNSSSDKQGNEIKFTTKKYALSYNLWIFWFDLMLIFYHNNFEKTYSAILRNDTLKLE